MKKTKSLDIKLIYLIYGLVILILVVSLMFFRFQEKNMRGLVTDSVEPKTTTISPGELKQTEIPQNVVNNLNQPISLSPIDTHPLIYGDDVYAIRLNSLTPDHAEIETEIGSCRLPKNNKCILSGIIDFTIFFQGTNSLAEAKLLINKTDTANECIEKWQCTEFQPCEGIFKTRTCNEVNNCNTEIARPNEISKCSKKDLLNVGKKNPEIPESIQRTRVKLLGQKPKSSKFQFILGMLIPILIIGIATSMILAKRQEGITGLERNVYKKEVKIPVKEPLITRKSTFLYFRKPKPSEKNILLTWINNSKSLVKSSLSFKKPIVNSSKPVSVPISKPSVLTLFRKPVGSNSLGKPIETQAAKPMVQKPITSGQKTSFLSFFRRPTKPMVKEQKIIPIPIKTIGPKPVVPTSREYLMKPQPIPIPKKSIFSFLKKPQRTLKSDSVEIRPPSQEPVPRIIPRSKLKIPKVKKTSTRDMIFDDE